jgi:hypothetical protein
MSFCFNIWWGLTLLKLLFARFAPASCYNIHSYYFFHLIVTVFWRMTLRRDMLCDTIFRVDEGATIKYSSSFRKVRGYQTTRRRIPRNTNLHAGSSLADFSALMMEARDSSETSVHTTTRRHIPENGTLHSHRCEILKSDIFYFSFNRVSNVYMTSVE